MVKILVTATGGPVFPLIMRMLKEVEYINIEIIAVDAAIDVSFLHGVSKSELVPYANHPDYPNRIQEVINNNNIDYVFPLSEEECLIISRMAEAGVLGATYIGNSHETLGKIIDKVACYQHLESAGIQVPEYHEIQNFDDMATKLSDLGYPHKKVVLRPKSGRGSRGFRVLDADYNRVASFSQNGPQVWMDFDLLRCFFEFEPDKIKDYFISEFLTGDLGGADIVAYNGQPLAVFPAFPKDGKWGAYTHVELKPHNEMAEFCSNCVVELGMHGLCNVEAGFAQDGNLKLIKVNPRTSATAHQNSLVGPNNMDLLMRAIIGKPITFDQEVKSVYRLYPDLIEVKS